MKAQLVTCFGLGSCPRFGFKFNFGSFPLRFCSNSRLLVMFSFQHGIMVFGSCL